MSQRSKNILLIFGFLAALVIAYNYSFSKTLELKKELRTLESKLLIKRNISSLNTQLLMREKFSDSILESHNLRNSSIQNNLLEFLNNKAENNSLEIVSFDPTHRIESEDGDELIFQIMLRGTYTNIEEVVHSIEQDYAFGELIHLQFQKKTDFRLRRTYLECLFIIRNYEN